MVISDTLPGKTYCHRAKNYERNGQGLKIRKLDFIYCKLNQQRHIIKTKICIFSKKQVTNININAWVPKHVIFGIYVGYK